LTLLHTLHHRHPPCSALIKEKDAGIADKERRTYELRRRNTELEKFKFVLDFKIKELKQQIEPREAEIGALKKQIKEVRGRWGTGGGGTRVCAATP
jgi:chromosome segregation ATPase